MKCKKQRRNRELAQEEQAAMKARIVEHLQTTGDTVTAAALACGISLTTLYRWRADDARFKAELRMAYDAGTDVLEQEAIRRGLAGVDKPVFYQGKRVSHIREYS